MQSSPSPQPPVPNPTAKPPGRPRALDETKLREICALISAGCGYESAARYVGCAASTIRREANRNPEFNEQLRRASLSSELGLLNAVRQAAHKYWRAGAWLLERVDAQRYGKQNARQLKPEQLAEFIEALGTILDEETTTEESRQRILQRMDNLLALTKEEVDAQHELLTKPRRKKSGYRPQPRPAIHAEPLE